METCGWFTRFHTWGPHVELVNLDRWTRVVHGSKFQPLLKLLKFSDFGFQFGRMTEIFSRNSSIFFWNFEKYFVFYLNSCVLLKWLKLFDQKTIISVSTEITEIQWISMRFHYGVVCSCLFYSWLLCHKKTNMYS
jgi:hypothetical protein